MRKIPSYPKITTKTNITFTQTQNININSPKSLGLAGIRSGQKKVFKANKEKQSRQSRQRPNTSDIANLKSCQNKSKVKLNTNNSQKNINELQLKKDYSNSNLNSRKQQSQHVQQATQQKGKVKAHEQQQIKKLQQKLKLLQKKIDTIKHQKQKSKKEKSKQPSSRRSQSKQNNKDNSSSLITNNDSKASLMNNYHKKRDANITTNYSNVSNSTQSNKILKKSYSDKNMMKAKIGRPPLKKNHQLTNLIIEKQKKGQEQQNQEEVIHKFVTQVAKNEKMVQHHHNNNNLKAQYAKQTCYYIQNMSKSLHDSDLMIYRQHLIQSIQTISYLQNIRKPSLKQLEKHSVSLPNSKHKYSIILDLDETLIHCNQHLEIPHDVSLKIKFPTGEKIDAGINIRPYAKELLRQLSQFCEVIVFTASHECYANVVLDYLDPKNQYVSHRLYRNHCWQTEQGIYIKDLRVLKNRNIQNILLVDNAAYSYFYQLQNGIPIIPFYDDKQDQELQVLVKYIKTIIKQSQKDEYLNTLQKSNHNYFKLSHYHQFQDLQLLVKKLYQNTISQFKLIHYR